MEVLINNQDPFHLILTLNFLNKTIIILFVKKELVIKDLFLENFLFFFKKVYTNSYFLFILYYNK